MKLTMYKATFFGDIHNSQLINLAIYRYIKTSVDKLFLLKHNFVHIIKTY